MKDLAKGYGGGTNEQKIKTPSCLPGLPPSTNSGAILIWRADRHSITVFRRNGYNVRLLNPEHLLARKCNPPYSVFHTYQMVHTFGNCEN